MDYDALEKRLKEVREDDHERGCEGRFYSCSCDYENQIDQALKDSQVAIADLRARNDALIEMCAKVVDNHRPDASFDDSASGAMERNALLDNVAAEIRSLAASREG